MKLKVRHKYLISTFLALSWALFSIWAAQPWISDLSLLMGVAMANAVIYGIAIIPGFMNAFLASSLLMDKRPARRAIFDCDDIPDITVLVAAYNEEEQIEKTIRSVFNQSYPGNISVIVVDDGSTDETADIVKRLQYEYGTLSLIQQKPNQGKAAALNVGLGFVTTELLITIDGDSRLFKDALRRIVERYLSDPPNTAAVAGATLVCNSRVNFVTRLQEWDYFLGIASVKRLQSMYQGTLVAQGAFSLYQTKVLEDIGGWKPVVGEDIVLTWDLLERGYRVGFAEDACLFTNVPTSWTQFIKQRSRWSRGMIEAFKNHWRLLFKPRLTTMFIWWNALFLYTDLMYCMFFVPGIILALFGIFWLAGPLTLILLPVAMLVNYVMFRAQRKMFKSQGLKIRKNMLGFFVYSLFYGVILQPACVFGYAKELLFGSKKDWGTKE